MGDDFVGEFEFDVELDDLILDNKVSCQKNKNNCEWFDDMYDLKKKISADEQKQLDFLRELDDKEEYKNLYRCKNK